MEIFLIKGRIAHSEYMGRDREFDDIRLVKALNTEQAREKFSQYWENQSSECSHSYFVLSCEVMETVQ
jgi:hypothetical protein